MPNVRLSGSFALPEPSLQLRLIRRAFRKRVNYGLARRHKGHGGEEGGAYAVNGLEFWDKIYRIIQIDRIMPIRVRTVLVA